MSERHELTEAEIAEQLSRVILKLVDFFNDVLYIFVYYDYR